MTVLAFHEELQKVFDLILLDMQFFYESVIPEKQAIFVLLESNFHSRLGASQESKYYTLYSTIGEHSQTGSG